VDFGLQASTEFAGFGGFFSFLGGIATTFLATVFFPFFCEVLAWLYFLAAMTANMTFFTCLRT
jgi:hypothetical protein